MKVILLKDIPRIGKKNDIKDVSDGFVQNALLPKKLAQIATPQAIAALKEAQAKAEKMQAQEIEAIKKIVEDLQAQKITLSLPANQQGHLFSKFKIEQLKKIFKEKGIVCDTKYIIPFEFKEIGIHTIKIKTPQVQGEFKIEIKGLQIKV
jgi:large subunit ribosomal protein L9